jgi:hypothetical protein
MRGASVLVRIILGLGVTVVGFGIAGRRFHWLSRLIRSGKPAPERTRGSILPKAEAEVTEVAGQRKLLQWTVPGLAHFFTMWGFTILLLTIVEAYGDLFQKTFHFPGIGQWDWVGFVEDFFAVMVLVALVVFSIIRLKNAPARKERQSRFYGSHTRGRLGHPGHDRRGHHHPAALPGAQVNTGRPPPVPLRLGRLRLPRHRQAAPPGRPRDQRRPGHHLPDPERGRHLGLHRLRLLLQAPAHLHGPHQRGLLPPAPGPGGPGQDARHGHGERRRGHRVRGGRGRPLLLEADAGLRHLHRVRALPVGLPGLEHREALSPKLLIMGLRDNMFASATPLLGGEGE